MGKPLDEYRKKRDFAKTPEPGPEVPQRRIGDPVFVVHRHDASRLHYDLRLEVDGVLCSWAVPRGFSYAPAEKRLAVRTEDHPMEYEHFHGVIPEGEYGAGSMTIWDRGHYELVKITDWQDALAKGEIKIVMRGRKLRGEWHLVKTKEKNQWLLFKSRDRYAGADRDSALGVDISQAEARDWPAEVQPMEIGEAAESFSDPEWLFEMKFAGRRALVAKDGDTIELRGVTAELPALRRDLEGLRAERALLDGVLVVQDEHERPQRELLEQRLSGKSNAPVLFYAFDLLYYEDYDLRSRPLVDRKAALQTLLPPSTSLLYADHVAGNGESLVDAVRAAGLPSVVAKRVSSSYRSGKSTDWREIPVRDTDAAAGLGVSEALARTRPSGPRRSKVKLSNLEKVFWPAEGYTKGDLIAYYEQVAAHLVPHLRDRPIHMNRFPDGIEGKSFYQRQAKEDLPDWVETVMIDSGSHGESVRQMICGDRHTLLYLANLGSIDLHPWLSRRDSLRSPDWAVVDLDPKEAPFTDVVKIARATGELLQSVGLRPYLKTSGKTGLHVYVPLKPGYTYDQSCMFCEGVARVVAMRHGDIATVERIPGKRGGRVYVDFLQNRRGQTVVPPYSVRPVRGATVSTPLHWDELDNTLHPSRFTIRTLPPRLDRHGDLFAKVLTDRQDLMPAIAALGEHLQGG